MPSGTDYDPDPDLAALRVDSAAKLAVVALFAIAVTELGTYMQLSTADGAGWVLAWIHGKLVLIAALVLTALRLGRMRPESRYLHPIVTIVATIESAGWAAFSMSHFVFSLFAALVVPASLFGLALVPSVQRSLRVADAARERLAQNGIDDPFA